MPRKASDVKFQVGEGVVQVPIRVSAYGQTQTFTASVPYADVAGKSEEELAQVAYDQQEQAIETTLVHWDFQQRRGEPVDGGLAGGSKSWKPFSPPAAG